MSQDMRRMAEFAESLASAGHDVWSIVEELNRAADAAEFGWAGSAHFGVTAGVVPWSEADELRYAVQELIDANDRAKTVPKDKLAEALNDEH